MIEDFTSYTEIDPDGTRRSITSSPMKITPCEIERIKEEAAKTGIRVIVSRSDMEDV